MSDGPNDDDDGIDELISKVNKQEAEQQRQEEEEGEEERLAVEVKISADDINFVFNNQ